MAVVRACGSGNPDSSFATTAHQAKVNGALSQPAPREFMIEIARAKNAVPLPLIRPGVHLPPPEHCNTVFSPGLSGNGSTGAAGVGGASAGTAMDVDQ